MIRWALRDGDGFSLSPPTDVFLGVRPVDLAEVPNSIGVLEPSGRVVMPPRLTGASPWFAGIDPSVPTTICRLLAP